MANRLSFQRFRRILLVVGGLCWFSAWPATAGDSWGVARQRMVDELATVEGMTSPRVLEAMRATPRHEFVTRRWRSWAYYDMALPIGYAQTLTPTSLVAYMTQQLDVQAHDRVLEVGTGCGYQAAILGRLAKAVYSVEIVRPLGRRAQATLRRLKHENVQIRIGDGYRGWPEMAPFDKIIVTCSPEKVPEPLIAQLAEGGRMIIPLGAPYRQILFRFSKVDGQLVREALVPTVFVPMTGVAEAARQRKADPLHPTLDNGAFEQTDPETHQLAAWYHQKQLTREQGADGPGGKGYVTFRNLEPGRPAQASQAFALDRRRLATLKVAGWVKGSNIRPGAGKHDIATVVIAFYDQDRAMVGQVPLGDWRDTFDWRPFEGQAEIPVVAREAIIQLGLHGATGSLSCAQLRLDAGSRPMPGAP